jgi:hypothetical protein
LKGGPPKGQGLPIAKGDGAALNLSGKADSGGPAHRASGDRIDALERSAHVRFARRPLLQTPLHALHLRLGARMVPFAGYAMPVQYPSGLMAEHKQCRESARCSMSRTWARCAWSAMATPPQRWKPWCRWT